MIPNEILIIIVGAVAYYLGYRMGRMTTLAELNQPRRREVADASDAEPLPGPDEPRAAPATGGGAGRSSPTPSVPRRTAAPPPARAGLLDPDGGSKDHKR